MKLVKRWAALFFCLTFVAALFLSEGFLAYASGTEKSSISDGTYTINGYLKNASSDQNSMGKAALVKPMEVLVKGGQATLRMEFVPLTTSLGSTNFTGYLALFRYFPDWEGGETGYLMPYDETPVSAQTESSYDGIYDTYNDPAKGTDSNVKGKLYPHYMTMPVTLNDPEIWTQVYVPVMETISKGNGLQYAKLMLDWSSLTKKSDGAGEEEPSTSQQEPTDQDNQTNQNNQSNQTSQNQTTETASVDKKGLYTMILSAVNLAGREGIYTSSSIKALKTAIAAAKKIYEKDSATQKEVNTQANALADAIIALEQKSSSGTGSTANSESLDIKNLEDGTYSLTGTMVKPDKKTASMANDAIGHTVKLTVKKSKYYITLDFKGLNINSQYGYLSRLKYFVSGYTLDQYGVPKGTQKNVTIDSYQKTSKGKKVSDKFGTNYPDKVTFPFIKEALDDGYVPLSVFVPIMEAISKGTGTQTVYLKLDLDSLQSAKSSSFQDTENSNTDNTQSAATTSAATSTAAKTTTTSALKSASALPASQTAENSTEAANAGGLDSAGLNENEVSSAAEDGGAEDSVYENTGEITSEAGEKKDTSHAAAIPSVMSFFAALAGVVYKAGSRRLFGK